MTDHDGGHVSAAASRNQTARAWLQGFEVLDDARMCSAVQPPDYKPTHGRMFPYVEELRENWQKPGDEQLRRLILRVGRQA